MKKYLEFIFSTLFALVIIIMVAIWQGMDSFIFAWIINFMLMLAVLAGTQTLKPKMTATYFKIKEWENDGKVYKWIGVNLFRKLLVKVGWEKLNKAANPVKKSFNALKQLEYKTRESEFGHLIIFFIVLIVAIFVGVYYGFTKSLSMHILNVILNLYPMAIQRYNRPRLQKIISRESNY